MSQENSVLVEVAGTALLSTDGHDEYRRKLARITLDSMVQFVGLLDANGTVLEINRVALDAVGIALAEVEGKPFWTTFWWQVSPEINAELKEMIRRAAQGEFVRWDAEIYGRAGGKETIIIDASLMPVRDDRGKVVFITAEGRDITEKKAYEREIARQREELAKLDQLKTQFFANISHEFRTPLTLMLGPLEDLLAGADEHLSAAQRERLDMIHRNGLRMQKLVNSLLDFSRVEAGRIEAVYESVELGSLTADLASSFRAACDKAGIELVVDTAGFEGEAYVDRAMWEKIVLNLVSNAFKFTLEGQIRVSLTRVEDQAVLRVQDSGTGIPEAELPKIFDRFHRVANPHARTHEGTGIGLALVQELTRLHGGGIEVESTLGSGSVFSVSIPLGSKHLPTAHVHDARSQSSTATRADAFVSEASRWLRDAGDPEEQAIARSPYRLLVVDDNADMRDYLQRLLTSRYDVDLAGDGLEALAVAGQRAPNLILTDIMMPRMDGFELLQRIREHETLRAVPVIMLSARAGDEAQVEGLQTGADDYLVKPFSARELLARIATNLELARMRTQHAVQMSEEAQRLRILNRAAASIAANLELEPLVQTVTDAARELTNAEFAAFFYNVTDERAESYQLYTLSGARREDFEKFPHPRNTQVFAPTFNGEGIVRSGDIRKDARYGKNAPNSGPPPGHLPVVSYLAVPVIAPAGNVIGGLFLAHSQENRFTEQDELVVAGIAAQAAVAFEKASLYAAGKRAQAELQRLNELLEQRVSAEMAGRKLLADIVEGTDAFVQVVDLDFRWLAINKASADEFERIYGKRPQLGMSMVDVLDAWPEHQQAVREVWSRALAGEEFTSVGEFGHSSLDRRCYEMKFNVLRDKSGQRIGAYQFAYDVTERLHSEAKLAEAQAALRQAQKLEAMGQLTGGVAHDFNNLLTPIIGSLDLLQRRNIGGQREQRSIANALQSAERAKTLVQRLLAFARRQPLQTNAVDVRSVIDGMAELVGSISGPQISVAIDVPEALPYALADANQLEMAILNLSVNSRDAMERGGTLRISARANVLNARNSMSLPPGNYVCISVADTGVGMDEQVMARAIEPFFSTKGIGKGTGLGLSMVHGLLSQLGGAMTISSRPGVGTNVTLWLPQTDEALPTVPDLDAQGANAGVRATKRILLVDDEKLVRESANDMLTDLGFTVIEAESAEAALQQLEGGLQVDILVTDHLMPGMSGVELVHAVRERWPRIRAVIVSGYADIDGMAADLERLSKPFRQSEIASLLNG
ncbi:MAG: ATP-binding protein [Steroidobacter sp.]